MANALIRRKTTTKPAPKPMSTVKGPKGSLGVEFRWSTSINQLNLIDLDSNTPQKSVLSFASTKSKFTQSFLINICPTFYSSS